MIEVQREYVSVGDRQVEVRIAGQGPLILLLHQSPQSSAEFTDLMQRWGEQYTLIAPDREGYGNSDPLAKATPSLEDFADSLVGVLDVWGIQRVPVYGFHTGGTVAIALALRHPERVVAVAANGVVALTPSELAEIEAAYLPPFVPKWDGSHLAWLWARMREQSIFFPWHRRKADSRMNYDLPSADRIHRNVLEFLRCWRTYDLAYGAAFRFDVVNALSSLRVPTLGTAAEWDPLFPHLDRLPSGPFVTVERETVALGAEKRSFAFLSAHATLPAHPVRAREGTGRAWWRSSKSALHGLALGPASGARVLVLHDAGDRAAMCGPLASELARAGYAVRVPDLPGHGDSADLAIADRRLGAISEHLRIVLGEWCQNGVSVVGIGHGSVVALALARALGGGPRRVVLLNPPVLGDTAEKLATDYSVPEPDWFGGHLQRLWHETRDAELFFPAHDRRRAAALRGDPDLDPVRLTDRVVARLLAGAAGPELARLTRLAPIETWLQELKDRVVLVVDERWPLSNIQQVHSLASRIGIPSTMLNMAANEYVVHVVKMLE